MTRTMTAAAMLLMLSLTGTVFAAGPYSDAYRALKPEQPTQTGNRIEVVEVFWYGCPHCYAFEPYVNKWQASLPDDVAFRRMPAVLNQSWIPHARAFYTAEKLNVLGRIHSRLFEALHEENQRLFSAGTLREFFVSEGIDADEFDRVYNSTEVDIKIKQAYQMARNYRITGVPSMVINGKYVTSGTLTGSFETMMNAVNHLVEQERQGQ